MKITYKDFLNIIATLNLPKILEDIYENRDIPLNLDWRFSSVKIVYEWKEENQEIYTKSGVIIPLWSNYNFSVITAYDTKQNRFLDIDTEEPDLYLDTYQTWGELVFSKFAEIARDDDYSINEIISLSKYFDLSSADILIQFLKRSKDMNYSEYELAMKNTRVNLNA